MPSTTYPLRSYRPRAAALSARTSSMTNAAPRAHRARLQLVEQPPAETEPSGPRGDRDRHDVGDLAAVVETGVPDDAHAVVEHDVVATRPPGELGPPRRLGPGVVREEVALERRERGDVGPPGLPQHAHPRRPRRQRRRSRRRPPLGGRQRVGSAQVERLHRQLCRTGADPLSRRGARGSRHPRRAARGRAGRGRGRAPGPGPPWAARAPPRAPPPGGRRRARRAARGPRRRQARP